MPVHSEMDLSELLDALRSRVKIYRNTDAAENRDSALLKKSLEAIESLDGLVEILTDKTFIDHKGEPVCTSDAALQEILHLKEEIEKLKAAERKSELLDTTIHDAMLAMVYEDPFIMAMLQEHEAEALVRASLSVVFPQLKKDAEDAKVVENKG